jgi:hypothetical protein
MLSKLSSSSRFNNNKYHLISRMKGMVVKVNSIRRELLMVNRKVVLDSNDDIYK